MSDDAISGELIDLQGFSLSELRDKIEASKLETALNRVLSDQRQVANHGFNNYI